MKIAEVRTHLLEHRLAVPFQSASMRFDRRAHVLVEIVCDNGLTGWGECLGPARPNAAVVAAYCNWLIGMNPLETEKNWAVLYNVLRDQGQRGLTVTALSGIDIALWDIKGKHFGASVSTLLGGRFRESVKAYATGSFKRDGVDRVEDNANDIALYRSQGFHASKIKVGFGIEEDLRVIRAAREAAGSEMRLMADANHGYGVLEAVEFGRRAAEYGLDWFEEPVVPEQLAAYREVRARQPIPVAGGETWHSRWGMKEPIESRAIDIVQPDLAGVDRQQAVHGVEERSLAAAARATDRQELPLVDLEAQPVDREHAAPGPGRVVLDDDVFGFKLDLAGNSHFTAPPVSGPPAAAGTAASSPWPSSVVLPRTPPSGGT